MSTTTAPAKPSAAPIAEISDREITRLLDSWQAGDNDAIDRLLPLIFEQVRELARRCFQGESPGVTLQPTALVNELYLKLVGSPPGNFDNRQQFFGYLATVIRNTLRDAGRKRRSLKRGGDVIKVSLDEALDAESGSSIETALAIAEALDQLAEEDERQAKIVELRYFLGLPFDEIKEIFQVSRSQIYREWDAARLFLFDTLS